MKNHAQYYKKYKDRIKNLFELAQLTLQGIEKSRPALAGKIAVSYPNIVMTSTRYFNDVVRLKAMHKIENTHKSKMLAYTTKWLSLYPPFSLSLTDLQYQELSDEDRYLAFEVNYLFVESLIDYYYKASISVANEPTRKKISSDISYLMKTGLFEEHCVSAMLSIGIPDESL